MLLLYGHVEVLTLMGVGRCFAMGSLNYYIQCVLQVSWEIHCTALSTLTTNFGIGVINSSFLTNSLSSPLVQ